MGLTSSTGTGVSQRGQRLAGPRNRCPQKQATVQDMSCSFFWERRVREDATPVVWDR
jgi:hypothetical protein